MATNYSGPDRMAADRQVYVFATTRTATGFAIRWGQQVQQSQRGQLILVIAHVVPYGTDLEHCGHNLAVLAEPYRAMLADCEGGTIRIYVCRDERQVLDQLVPQKPGDRRWPPAPVVAICGTAPGDCA